MLYKSGSKSTTFCKGYSCKNQCSFSGCIKTRFRNQESDLGIKASSGECTTEVSVCERSFIAKGVAKKFKRNVLVYHVEMMFQAIILLVQTGREL